MSNTKHKSKREEILDKMPTVKDRYGICPTITAVVDHLIVGTDPIRIIDQLLFVNSRAQDQLNELILKINK